MEAQVEFLHEIDPPALFVTHMGDRSTTIDITSREVNREATCGDVSNALGSIWNGAGFMKAVTDSMRLRLYDYSTWSMNVFTRGTPNEAFIARELAHVPEPVIVPFVDALLMKDMMTRAISGKNRCQNMSTTDARFSIYTRRRKKFLGIMVRNRSGNFNQLFAIYLPRDGIRGSQTVCGDFLYGANRSPNLANWYFPHDVDVFRNMLIGKLAAHQRWSNRDFACPDISVAATIGRIVFTKEGLSLMCGNSGAGFVALHMLYEDRPAACISVADLEIVKSMCMQMTCIQTEIVNEIFQSRKIRSENESIWPRSVLNLS